MKDSRRESNPNKPERKSFRKDSGQKGATRRFSTDQPRGKKRSYFESSEEESSKDKRDNKKHDRPSGASRGYREDNKEGTRGKTRNQPRPGNNETPAGREYPERRTPQKKYRKEEVGRDRREYSGKAERDERRKPAFFKRERPERARQEKEFKPERRQETYRSNAPVRLNKFIAHAGICSRREADTLIQAGAISVNGQIVTELGTKVNPGDIVRYGDQRLINERKVYLLLNKPKDFITTSDDPAGRKTVLDLVYKACPERIYPVGRLDRNTTGLLLFTNDGEMAKKLTHPKHGVRKIYHVHLDKALSKNDLMEIASGVELEDTKIIPDSISYVEGAESKKEIGIEIHSGQNRVVRRIFEKFGYDVVKLDRVSFAGLTKKDLPRGKWRFLNEKEVNFLKMRK